MGSLYYGTIIHTPTLLEFEIFNPGIVVVNAKGIITLVTRADKDLQTLALVKQYKINTENITLIPKDGFLLPGFVDTHVHAPQYVFTGTGYDLPLLDWLNKYTFPRESSFKDAEYAQDAYGKVVTRLLRSGTTTACYFGTIHGKSCEILAQKMIEKRQRGFVGKVNMDQNAPEWYCESTEASIADTECFIAAITAMDESRLVVPVVTPRFAPTCTTKLLRSLADLAKTHKLPIQTHVSENKKECEWVQALFPDSKDYCDVYDNCGLLGSQTILAHAIHLTERERKVLLERKAGISHCPTSNFCLKSGVLNLRQLLEEGQKVGLGTDVSGGYSPSMLVSIRDAITASKLTELDNDKYPALSLHEAFYLATMGGAEVVSIAEKIGSFSVGKEFDAQIVDLGLGTTIDLFPHDGLLEKLEKWIYNGDDRQVWKVYVRGQEVSI